MLEIVLTVLTSRLKLGNNDLKKFANVLLSWFILLELKQRMISFNFSDKWQVN